jgi:pSer/pThr/pTyr-binding forkhead associated (FHA) protein
LPETRADLKAACIRGFALSDELAERFLRAFEHGCALRFGVKVPVVLRSFGVRAVAAETFDATLTTLVPAMPLPDQTGAPISQLTEPIRAIRPKRTVTKINAPPPASERRASGPILIPEKARTRLVLKQSDQPEGQNNLPGEWLLTRDTISMGRMPECDLCLADDKRVSRQHAVIHRAPTAYILTDLNSSNGTFLNGTALTEPTVLHSGDSIRIGHTELTFLMEPLPDQHSDTR